MSVNRKKPHKHMTNYSGVKPDEETCRSKVESKILYLAQFD